MNEGTMKLNALTLALATSTVVLVGCSGGAAPQPAATITITATETATVKVVETVTAEPAAMEPASAEVSVASDAASGPWGFTDGQIAVWLAAVEEATGNSTFTRLDAEWACDRLKEAGDEAAWEMVGSERDLLSAELLCTEFKDEAALARAGFWSGDWVVGEGEEEVKPGTYVSRPKMKDCYWERVTDNGEIIDNAFVSSAPKGAKVTIKESDGGFNADGCGGWVKAK